MTPSANTGPGAPLSQFASLVDGHARSARRRGRDEQPREPDRLPRSRRSRRSPRRRSSATRWSTACRARVRGRRSTRAKVARPARAHARGAQGRRPPRSTVLRAQGYTTTTVRLSIDGLGFIRRAQTVVRFADGGTVTGDTTFSDFGCSSVVMLPNGPSIVPNPAGCTARVRTPRPYAGRSRSTRSGRKRADTEAASRLLGSGRHRCSKARPRTRRRSRSTRRRRSRTGGRSCSWLLAIPHLIILYVLQTGRRGRRRRLLVRDPVHGQAARRSGQRAGDVPALRAAHVHVRRVPARGVPAVHLRDDARPIPATTRGSASTFSRSSPTATGSRSFFRIILVIPQVHRARGPGDRGRGRAPHRVLRGVVHRHAGPTGMRDFVVNVVALVACASRSTSCCSPTTYPPFALELTRRSTSVASHGQLEHVGARRSGRRRRTGAATGAPWRRRPRRRGCPRSR